MNGLLEIRDTVESYSIFAGGTRVGTYTEDTSDSSTETNYHYQDHLGGTTITTDEDGTVTQLYDFAPYGSQVLDEQLTDAETPHSFTDKEFDSDLGLYYFEARWYSPVIGSFVSVDPMANVKWDEFMEGGYLMDPQMMNTYSYARNNPLYYTDPTGELAITQDILRREISYMLDIFYNQTGRYWTTVMMNHSLQDNPSDLHYGVNSSLSEAIQESNECQDLLEQINFQQSEGLSSNNEYMSMAFTSGDLHTSLGKVGVNWGSYELDDGSVLTIITITDIYNFEYDSSYNNTVISTVNNAAVLLEDLGVIQDYQVTIQIAEITETSDENI